jgi:hypothetical protein
MRCIKPLLAFGEKYLDRVVCVMGAGLGAQGPEFMQQYLQRLGGQLDEARRQLESWRQVARSLGLSLDELIARYGANADPAVVRGGAVVRGLVARVDELAATETALRHAALGSRPWVFLGHLDWGTAQATWAVFRPALPTTLEGIVYAATGLALTLALYQGMAKPLAKRFWKAIASPRGPKRRAPGRGPRGFVANGETGPL